MLRYGFKPTIRVEDSTHVRFSTLDLYDRQKNLNKEKQFIKNI